MRFSSKLFSTYPWHSINLIPSAALVMTYDEEDNGVVRYGTMLELTLFGQVFTLHTPIRLKRSHMLPTWGLLWSKRRRVWYRAGK